MRVTAQGDSEAGTTVLFAALRKQHSESTVFADYFEQSKFSMPVIVVFGFVNHTIHMNGRIYDPQLGRMLQADPFIQAPGNTQSYNRYSYVQNNPLRYTDPSGYNWKDWVGPVIAVVGAVLCYNPQCGVEIYMAIGATSGGASAAANGGDFVQGAVVGGISGAAFYGVGTAVGGEHFAVQAFAIGTVGGATSAFFGGDFGHGFISAGAGALIPGGAGGNSVEMMALRTIGRAIIGGTVSELTGGKFANGAATAAFASIVSETAYSYNEEYKIAGNCRTRVECGDISKDPILEMADALEMDGEFQYARSHASGTASRLGAAHESDYGVVVKLDRRWYEYFGVDREPGALIDISNNRYSVTEAFVRTATDPVQPVLSGYILSPAPITNAVSVSIYRYTRSPVVDYNSYARSANAPVYVQSRRGGCVVYGASSARGC